MYGSRLDHNLVIFLLVQLFKYIFFTVIWLNIHTYVKLKIDITRYLYIKHVHIYTNQKCHSSLKLHLNTQLLWFIWINKVALYGLKHEFWFRLCPSFQPSLVSLPYLQCHLLYFSSPTLFIVPQNRWNKQYKLIMIMSIVRS